MRRVARVLFLVVAGVCASLPSHLHGGDCNGNGVEDSTDVSGGSSSDCNENSVPDECERLPVSQLVRSSQLPKEDASVVLVADLDGADDLDIVTVSLNDRSASLYFMEDGRYQSFRGLRVALPGQQLPLSFQNAQAADFDRDGDMDLAFAGGRAVLLENDGRAAFGEPIDLGVSDSGDIVIAADVDRDGATDIVLGGVRARVLLNKGDGEFGEPVESPWTPLNSDSVAADLDGDGQVDLITPSTLPASFTVSWNAGDGRFLEPVSHTLERGARHVSVADLDGDQDLDLAMGGEPASTISIFENRGGRELRLASQWPVESLRTVTAADFNGDGEVDLAAGSFDLATTFLNVGGGTFARSWVARGSAPRPRDAATGDLDGDGVLDLVLVAGDWSAVFLTRPLADDRDCNGNGALDECDIATGLSQDTNANALPDDCEPVRFHRGDASGDGELNVTDAVLVLRFLFAGDASPSCLETADVENDGALDLTDGVGILRYLFSSGSVPASPGPPGAICGPDPDPAGGPGDLGCSSYGGCANP